MKIVIIAKATITTTAVIVAYKLQGDWVFLTVNLLLSPTHFNIEHVNLIRNYLKRYYGGFPSTWTNRFSIYYYTVELKVNAMGTNCPPTFATLTLTVIGCLTSASAGLCSDLRL